MSSPSPTSPSAARAALALPPSRPPLGARQRSNSPMWTRPSSYYSRRSRPSPYSALSTSPGGEAESTLRGRLARAGDRWQRQARRTWRRLSPLQQVLIIIAGVGLFVLGVLFLVYNERIGEYLKPKAEQWRNMRGGWLILWALVFLISFPPLFGYSTLLTVAGFLFGFPNGWFVVSTATVAGSTASFLASRSLLKDYVARLVAHDTRFAALALTLKHDGLKLLVMIRLCPLPYSLSNGALATFPTVTPAAFALASALATPKLLLPVFVGARLAELARDGSHMDARTKAVSYLSIVISIAAGVAAGAIMYRKTQARAAELEAAEQQQQRQGGWGPGTPSARARSPSGGSAGSPFFEDGGLAGVYADDPELGLGAGFDGADDISLRSAYADADAAPLERRYMDDFSDDEVEAGEDEGKRGRPLPPRGLFSDGDGEADDPIGGDGGAGKGMS